MRNTAGHVPGNTIEFQRHKHIQQDQQLDQWYENRGQQDQHGDFPLPRVIQVQHAGDERCLCFLPLQLEGKERERIGHRKQDHTGQGQGQGTINTVFDTPVQQGIAAGTPGNVASLVLGKALQQITLMAGNQVFGAHPGSFIASQSQFDRVTLLHKGWSRPPFQAIQPLPRIQDTVSLH